MALRENELTSVMNYLSKEDIHLSEEQAGKFLKKYKKVLNFFGEVSSGVRFPTVEQEGWISLLVQTVTARPWFEAINGIAETIPSQENQSGEK